MNDLDAEPASTTPVSPTKRKFSFRFPSASYHDHDSKNERRNYSDEAQSIPDLQVCGNQIERGFLQKKTYYTLTSGDVEPENNFKLDNIDQNLHNSTEFIVDEKIEQVICEVRKLSKTIANEIIVAQETYPHFKTVGSNNNVENTPPKPKTIPARLEFSSLGNLTAKAKACLSPKFASKFNLLRIFNKHDERKTFSSDNISVLNCNDSEDFSETYSLKDIDAISDDGSGVWI